MRIKTTLVALTMAALTVLLPANAQAAAKLKLTSKPKAAVTSTSAMFKVRKARTSGALECKLDKGRFKRCKNTVRYRGLRQGKHSFTVRLVANRAVKASHYWIVDRSAPAGQKLGHNNEGVGLIGGLTNDTELDFFYNTGYDKYTPLRDYEVKLYKGPLVAGTCGRRTFFGRLANGKGKKVVASAKTPVESGHCYRLRLVVKDLLGNEREFNRGLVQVDQTAPAAAFDNADGSKLSGSAAVVSGTVVDEHSSVATVAVTYTGPKSGSLCSATTGVSTFSCPLDTTALDEGLYTFTVTATDMAGNESSNSVTLEVDNVPAGVTFTQSGGNTAVTEGGATDTYTVQLDDAPKAPVTISIAGDDDASVAPATLTFTAANFSTAQTVTVTATDDTNAEGDHTATLTHTLDSDDSEYAALSLGSLSATVTDNEVAGITVVESGGSTDVVEGGASDTYTLTLDSAPSADVVITLADDTQVDVVPATLTFTTANFATPQTVTVTAADDASVEAAVHAGAITHSVASSDTDYNTMAVAPVAVNVTDNDAAGVSITESGGSTDVAEGGTTDSYDVVLTSEPTANVTINLTGDAQVGTDVPVLTFTPANYSIAQTVTVTAIDDASIEAATHTGVVTHSVASTDADFNGIAVTNVTANVVDNDAAGISITETGGQTDVTEAGGTDTYDVVLTAEPTADVSVQVSDDAQVNGLPGTLIFTTANWNTPQTVTVYGTDDAVAEAATHVGVLTHLVTSSDSNYNAILAPDVNANVLDNDVASVAITESAGTTEVWEGGASDTYDVVLTSVPSADVVITLTDDTQVDATPATLTFTSANYATPQTVTVTATDDSVVEADGTGTIQHVSTSGDADYNGATVADVVVDVYSDDVAGVNFTESGGTTDATEGGATDTYTVALNSEPTADVTITMNGNGQTTTDVPALTFTSANWNTPQAVTVTAVDDAIAEGDPHYADLDHTIASSDPEYNGVLAVSVAISDNDVAGIGFTESGGTTDLDETGPTTDTYDVFLTSEPTANVTITLVDGADATADQATLTFTPTDYATPQTVTLTAVDDAIDEGAHAQLIDHVAASTDPAYNGYSNNLSAAITDNDVAGITYTPSGGTTDVAEAGATSDSYDVVLDSEPTANVVVAVGAGDQVTVDQPTLTFTAANWNVAQTVTVTAVNDAVDEADPHVATVANDASSADANYNGVANPQAVNVSDDDTAGVTVAETSISTDVTEGGATDTYTVVLDSEPTANVTVNVSDDAEVDVDQATLTFTSGDWNVPQVITVTATDDIIADGDTTGAIIHGTTSADSSYNALTPAGVVVNVTDDEVASLIVVGAPAVDETGPTSDTFTVALSHEPTGTVTVSLVDDGEVSLDLPTLVFTPADWSTPQTVTATAIDDLVTEGAHVGSVSFMASSTDGFNGVIDSILINITDND